MNDSAIKGGGMTEEKAPGVKKREKVRADGKTVRANTVKLIILAVLVLRASFYICFGTEFRQDEICRIFPCRYVFPSWLPC